MLLSNLALVTVTQGLPQNAPLNCLATGGICIGARAAFLSSTPLHRSSAHCCSGCQGWYVGVRLLAPSCTCLTLAAYRKMSEAI